MNRKTALQRVIDRIDVPVERKTVSAGTIKTAYLEAGSGDPVLLLHGVSAAGITWYPVIGPLAAHYRVIAPDIVGYGESDKPAADYGPPYYCAWLAAFLDAVGVEQAHVIGHSKGGAISLRFALDSPARVKSLVLVDSAGLGVGSGASPGALLAMLCYNLFPSRTTGLWLTRQVLYDPQNLDPALGEYIDEVIKSPGGRRALLRGRAHTRIPPEQLAQNAQPTLIIWGQDDRLLPVAQAKAAAKELPNAQLRVMPEAGHTPFIDQPQQFNDAVLSFLNAVGTT